MASKHGPVAVVSSDGLPPGLVILSDESVPIDLNSQLARTRNVGREAAIINAQQIGENGQAEKGNFNSSIGDHGASMVSNLSPIQGNMDDSDRIDDAAIVQWLQDILVEDDYGKVDCKDMINFIQKQFGSKKRKTRAWLKRAFPKSYLRRSDRNRWFCGVSFRADQGKSVISIKDKEWIDKAVSWLQTGMEMNPTAKERCSDVHHALTQYVGQAAVHMAISAVKMVFPNIPRKTFSRIAFYVGIRFKDSTLSHPSSQSAATTLNSLSDTKTEYSDSAANKLVVAWLQKALIADESSRERIKTICFMIKKKFGRTLPQAKVARLIKKVFPNVTIKLKGSIYGIVWGVRIDHECHPTSQWLQKAISWFHEIYEPADASFCENLSPLFDLLSQKLGIEKHSHCLTFLHEAFPNIEIKEILDCQMAFGIKQKRSIDDVQLPYFTDEEQAQNDDIIHFLDNYSVLNDEKLFDEPSMVYSSAATSVPQFTVSQMVSSSEMQIPDSSKSLEIKLNSINENLKEFSDSVQNEICGINCKIAQMEDKLSTVMEDMSQVKDEINKLIKDNLKSVQQKDSLIIQLQQTLIMLCQQQLQKFMPGDQSFPPQALTNIIQKGLISHNQNPES